MKFTTLDQTFNVNDTVVGLEADMVETSKVPTTIDSTAEHVSTEVVEPVVEEEISDVEYARQKLKGLIAKGEEAVETLLAIAKDSEKSRDFEVIGSLITSLTTSTKTLIDVQTPKKGERAPATTVQKQTNIMFTGTTRDMMRLIKEQNEKDITEE